jgi:hypothetical protein
MGKVLLFINLTRVTYNSEINHYSLNLVLGSSLTVLQLLLYMILFTQWLQKVGAKGMQNWVEFLYNYFSSFQMGPLPLIL